MAEMSELSIQLQKLGLQHKSALSLEKKEPHYVLDMAFQNKSTEDGLLAATSSNYCIRLFVRSRLTQTAVLTGHTDVVSGVRWLHSDENLLLTSSHDQTVRLWDTRASNKKEMQMFRGENETDLSFLSCDINSSDQAVCAGTVKIKEDAYLLFWDLRKTNLLGCYEDSHQDDITQVRFHPSKENSLLTGSMDGLVNLFDIEQTSEDDALLSTYNTESTVERAGWCGPETKYVYCITHQVSWHVWDTESDDDVQKVRDLQDRLEDKCKLDYLVDCIPAAASSDDFYLVGGSNTGDLHFLDFSDDKEVKVVRSLEKGHTDTVRCLHWDRKSRTLVTGGEDSILCLWSPDAETVTEASIHKQGKMKGKKVTASSRSAPYKGSRK